MKIKRMPPWVRATKEGRLDLDLNHPEWIKYFIAFVMDPKKRIVK